MSTTTRASGSQSHPGDGEMLQAHAPRFGEPVAGVQADQEEGTVAQIRGLIRGELGAMAWPRRPVRLKLGHSGTWGAFPEYVYSTCGSLSTTASAP